ncbi:PerC family transcriptional regulator [Klebsiella aerogenes]|uniref:PerC family transcriptional regulator n=1 Tax=Klebsiella aerogenes TaxID=548 RepID=UPI003792D52A
MRNIVSDVVAENLEMSGFWRRAATRWLKVMDKPGITPNQREWLRQRRIYCMRQLTKKAPFPGNFKGGTSSGAASISEAVSVFSHPRRTFFSQNDVIPNKKSDN